jgi:hypothetical protein
MKEVLGGPRMISSGPVEIVSNSEVEGMDGKTYWHCCVTYDAQQQDVGLSDLEVR